MGTNTSSTKILKIEAVATATSLSKSSIYRLVKKRQFPQPVRVTIGTTGFVESEVQAWLQSKIAARPAPRGEA